MMAVTRAEDSKLFSSHSQLNLDVVEPSRLATFGNAFNLDFVPGTEHHTLDNATQLRLIVIDGTRILN